MARTLKFKDMVSNGEIPWMVSMEESGAVERLDSNNSMTIAESFVLESRGFSYDPARDGDNKFPSGRLFKLADGGGCKIILAVEAVNELSDEEYDNTFKAIKARSVEDALFSAATGLYASIRGYLGW